MIATLNDNLFSKGYRLIKKRLGHANREKIPKVRRDSDAPGGYSGRVATPHVTDDYATGTGCPQAGATTVSRPKKGRTAQGGEKRPNVEQSKGGCLPPVDMRATPAYSHALRLVSKLPDLRAANANHASL